jgi:hypothetical protein
MISSKDEKPPVGGLGGSIHDWERGLSPWHVDAFKGTGVSDTQLDNAVCVGVARGVERGVRQEGWFAVNGWGDYIGFVPDGTDVE